MMYTFELMLGDGTTVIVELLASSEDHAREMLQEWLYSHYPPD